MAEQVGSVFYEVSLDTSKLIAGQREADAAIAKVDTTLTAVSKATKTHIAMVQAQAAALKENAKAAADAAAADAKLGEAATQAAAAMAKQTISAKQLVQATRGIPAQFTDIFTSIAAGQNPMQVLLQQGGQLKDMFGGIGPAASAMGRYIVGLINPITIAAAAIGLFLVGLVKGRQEMSEFNRNVQLTGGISGNTADQLNAMAASMDKLDGVTRGKAAEALNIFTAAGVTGTKSLQKFAEAAIRLEQVGGPAVEETAKQFKALERDPVAASLKLNEAVNFLTADVFKQIKALDEQGKHVEAAKIAQNAYADAILSRTPKIVENLGLLEKAWRGITNFAKEAWDAMLGVGRAETPEERIAATRKHLEDLQAELANNRVTTKAGGQAVSRSLSGSEVAEKQKLIDALREEVRLYERAQSVSNNIASADAQRATTVAALAEFEKDGDKFMQRRARMELDITKARELGRQAGVSELEIQKRVADIRRSFGFEQQRLAAQVYLEGIVTDNKTAAQKIDAEEQRALVDNDRRRAADRDNADIYGKAKVAIAQKYAQQRAELEERTQQQIAELGIAMTINEVDKIAAIRDEAFRHTEAQERLGVITAQEAARARALATFLAANSYADVAERNARARGEALIAITKSQEQNIALVRDEAVRQAEESYRRGKITFEEMEAAKTVAVQRAVEQRKALEASRDQTQIQTLQLRANTGGSDATEALIRAQAAAQLKAVEEARLRDLEASQIYADQKVAIEADMNQRIAAMRAQANITALTATADAFGAMVNVLRTSSGEQSAVFKVMFAAQKAFALASAVVAIQTGIANAAALPFPANLAAMASVIAATANIIGIISGANYGGGRQYGGPVSANSWYRINEGGRPEMFTASNGAQYLMPTRDGKVTPAKEGGGGGGPTQHVEIHQTNNFNASGGGGRDGRSDHQMSEDAMMMLRRSQRVA